MLSESESEDVNPEKDSKRKDPPQEYEKLLIRLEAEVRNHIKIE
jgi:hypothetical protein